MKLVLATVYNCRIADYHTYFVQAPGSLAWLWAHNACNARVIGETAEHAARSILRSKGHKIIGSIKNGSGHGIDLITRKGGKLFAWEVKGSTVGKFKLSADQAKGVTWYVTDRLNKAASKWKVDQAIRVKARQLLNEIRTNGIRGGIIHIPDMFSGVGSTVRFLPWLP